MTLIRRDFKTIFFFIIKMIGVWIMVLYAFMFFRNYGIGESHYFQSVQEFDFQRELSIGLLGGILMGTLYSIMELFFDRTYFRKLPFGKIIFTKNILYIIGFVIVYFLLVAAYSSFIGSDWNVSFLLASLQGKFFIVLLLYFLIVSLSISFILQVSQKFGPGMLWKFFTGEYHQPKEEERLFLFIDMRSSTTIAEQLGHLKFSSLIQDCFFDLTEVVAKHQVDIYQYVGDEAVLSWQKEIGITEKRCLHAYFDFMEVLKSRKEYYLETYGLEPFFKAGLHMGKVTVAEVGVIKKEIAYHGDVLNTAARIQGECNKLGQAMLVSEAVINNLSSAQDFDCELMDTPLLKGKNKKVQIFGVKPA